MPILRIFIIALVIVIRETLDNVALDFAYVVLFVYFVKYLYINSCVAKTALAFLGKYSTNMWLTHTFFCYYFGMFAKSIMLFRFAVPTLIVLLIYSLVALILITFFWESVTKAGTKILALEGQANRLVSAYLQLFISSFWILKQVRT